MSSPTIYLTPTSNEDALENLNDTVIEGVDYTEYDEHIARDVDDSTLYIWGTKDKFHDRYEFTRGDIMLFYTGDGLYTVAGFIRETTINEELSKALWGLDDTDATEGTDPWSHIIYLDPPIEVEIEGSDIAQYADYNMDYVLGLQTLNEKGHNAIREEYETNGIPGFIIDNSHLTENEVRERSPILDEQISDGVETEEEPTPQGLSATEPWQDRVEALAGLLERSNQLLLRGPDMAVSRAQARQFARSWLEDKSESGNLKDRILEVSIDTNTSYHDLVEDIVTSPDTNTGITTTDGVFKRACRLAHAHKNETEYEGETDPPYVLLVELRADITLEDALGPIAYVLDPDNRVRELTIQLPHTGETLCIPNNLYIIVIDAGKALSPVDTETRRRFRVVEYTPNSELLSKLYIGESTEKLEQDPTNASVSKLTVLALNDINRYLVDSDESLEAVGQDHFIAYGNSDTIDSDTDLEPGQYGKISLLDIWLHDVLPYLRSVLANPDPLLERCAAVQELVNRHAEAEKS